MAALSVAMLKSPLVAGKCPRSLAGIDVSSGAVTSLVSGLAHSERLAVGDHQRNANRLGLTLGAGVVTTVCLLGLVGRSGGVVAGRVRCAAGSGRASR